MTSLSYKGYDDPEKNYYIPLFHGLNDRVISENFLKRKLPGYKDRTDDPNYFVKIKGFKSLIERFLMYFHMENEVKEISVIKVKKNHIVKLTFPKESAYIFRNGYCTLRDITEHFGYFSCEGNFDSSVNFKEDCTELILDIHIY